MPSFRRTRSKISKILSKFKSSKEYNKLSDKNNDSANDDKLRNSNKIQSFLSNIASLYRKKKNLASSVGDEEPTEVGSESSDSNVTDCPSVQRSEDTAVEDSTKATTNYDCILAFNEEEPKDDYSILSNNSADSAGSIYIEESKEQKKSKSKNKTNKEKKEHPKPKSKKSKTLSKIDENSVLTSDPLSDFEEENTNFEGVASRRIVNKFRSKHYHNIPKTIKIPTINSLEEKKGKQVSFADPLKVYKEDITDSISISSSLIPEDNDIDSLLSNQESIESIDSMNKSSKPADNKDFVHIVDDLGDPLDNSRQKSKGPNTRRINKLSFESYRNVPKRINIPKMDRSEEEKEEHEDIICENTSTREVKNNNDQSIKHAPKSYVDGLDFHPFDGMKQKPNKRIRKNKSSKTIDSDIPKSICFTIQVSADSKSCETKNQRG